jgi:hypothetical protein
MAVVADDGVGGGGSTSNDSHTYCVVVKASFLLNVIIELTSVDL